MGERAIRMQRSCDDKRDSKLGVGVRAWLVRGGLLLCLLGILCPPASATAQGAFTFPLTKTFKTADASGWEALTVLSGAPVDNGDGTETVTYRSAVPYSAGARSFVRLRVTEL